MDLSQRGEISTKVMWPGWGSNSITNLLEPTALLSVVFLWNSASKDAFDRLSLRWRKASVVFGRAAEKYSVKPPQAGR